MRLFDIDNDIRRKAHEAVHFTNAKNLLLIISILKKISKTAQ